MLQTAMFDQETVLNAVNSVNWLQPTWDLFIILFFVVASLIYGVSLGRDRIIVILVSIYIALAIVNYIPFLTGVSTAEVSVNDTFALRVSIFLGIFILLFFFLSHSALMKVFGHGASAQGKFWQVMIYSFLHVGLLISVTLSFFPADLANVLSPLSQTLFMSDIARAVWVTLPVVAMAVFGTGDKND
ncbi:MAG: hypothetical protein NUV84_05685 [Candidatus Uhrbacteria bacterium]|nr:hypothetical protein [Candidatus Uhrbacteria bacterium]